MEDERETEKENEQDYYKVKNPPKTLSSLADLNVLEETDAETASNIIKKSRKTILDGMFGGLDQPDI